MVKFDRKGYRRRTRLLILTNKSFYLNKIFKNKLKPKEKIPLDFINKLEVTSGRDNFLLVKISPQISHNKVCIIINLFNNNYTYFLANNIVLLFFFQGDIILEVPYLIEFVTKFINISKNCKLLNIIDLSCVDKK